MSEVQPEIFSNLDNFIYAEFIVHSFKYLRSMTLGFKDIGIRKSEFVAKIQFL